MKIRFNRIADRYAQEVYRVRRMWDNEYVQDQLGELWVKPFIVQIRELQADNEKLFGLPYKHDLAMAYIKLLNNWAYARENGNEFFLRSSFWDFPVMDSIMGEGPYAPEPDAIFGREDRHVILTQGQDSHWLIRMDDDFKYGYRLTGFL